MYSVYRLNAYKEKKNTPPQKKTKKKPKKKNTQTKTKNKQECKMFENLFITFFKTQCHNTYLYIFKNVYMCFTV